MENCLDQNLKWLKTHRVVNGLVQEESNNGDVQEEVENGLINAKQIFEFQIVTMKKGNSSYSILVVLLEK